MYHLIGHIHEIGEELHCKIDWTVGMRDGMMYVEEEPPRIEIQSFDLWEKEPEKCYAVALHELGHVFHGHTQGRPPFIHEHYYFDNGVLKSEAEAWKFALDNTIIDWTEETMDFALNTCLLSYYQGALWASDRPDRLMNGNRHHHEFVWDKPDDYFWSVAKRLGYDR